ncbi:translation initiation factor [Pollutibacter soli]|uniref:translation initiation factor n=1 Tax=Pollutibacter soli TaxID=3034157 RepID=UPI0030141A22
MNKKKKADDNGYVYSTDPGFQFEESAGETATPDPSKQNLRIRYETKHRGGKAVTIVTGFLGKEDDMEDLGKKLKSFCGTGGSVKDGEILIQGDQREKVRLFLAKNKYSFKG